MAGKRKISATLTGKLALVRYFNVSPAVLIGAWLVWSPACEPGYRGHDRGR
jgi:hypothetical protein